MLANPLNGRPSSRRKVTAIALVVAGAVVLSTGTVLGLRWAASPHGKAPMSQQAQGLGFTRLNRMAPGVALPNLRGGPAISLTRLAGKPIVLNFWSSTCEVCKSETPAIAGVARTLGTKIDFVGIDSVDRHSAAMAFVGKYQVPYQIAFDPQGSAAIAYGVVALPVTFFLSPSGTTILGENVGALSAGKLRTILHELYGTA